MIHAVDAYEMTLDKKRTRLDARLEEIEKHINDAREKGEFEVTIDKLFIDADLKEALENLCYEVERHDDQREGAWTKIKWDKEVHRRNAKQRW